MDLLRPTVQFQPKTLSSYSKNEAFLSLSSLFLFLFLLSFSFVTMILELLGLKKPAF